MDAAGIAGMLAGQKENIAAAMPAGLSNMLASAIPGLGNILGGAPKAAAEATTRTPVGAGAGTEPVASGSPLKWVVPLILAGLILYLLPLMFRRPATNLPPVAENKATETTPAAESTKLIAEGSNLIRSATENVASITDEASATAALPKLRETTSRLDGFRSLLAKLPPPVQSSVVDALRPLAANLREAARPVLALPVVGDRVKPTLDELLGQTDKLLAAPEAAR